MIPRGSEIRDSLRWLIRNRRTSIYLFDANGERSPEINARDGRWFENGRENLMVQGAIDIDLGWSPSTNTLPIKRLKLGIGQRSGEFVAAWVRFPGLTLQPLPQEYLRLTGLSSFRRGAQQGRDGMLLPLPWQSLGGGE